MTNNIFDNVKIQFEKLLSLLGNVLTCENEINIIQNKLRRHFNTTSSDYLCSNEFVSLLDHTHNLFNENNKSTKFFTLLSSFDEQLKKHSIKLSRINPSSTKPSICSSPITTNIESVSISSSTTTITLVRSSNVTVEDDIPSIVQEIIEDLLDRCTNILSELNEPTRSSITKIPPVTTNSIRQTNRDAKIRKLERRLNRLSRIIHELEEKDMSLDEMAHCDLYVVESNLKKQACEIHTKLAQLQSQSSCIERIIHQPITLKASETGHPLINNDLQEMVNQSKYFPSFTDVLDTVGKSNDKYNLNLNDDDRRSFAEKSFKVIGKEIKARRMADFHDIMYSRLPEDFNIEQNDPALDDNEIEQVLSENKRDAVLKTEKIFEEFSHIEADPELEVNLESSAESANEDEEEEEEEVINDEPDDIVDVPPSLSPEATDEISLNDRPLTILSIASLPKDNRESEVCNGQQQSQPLITAKECKVETLTARRKQSLPDNEIIYKLYTQRLTNNVSPISISVDKKRSLMNDAEHSKTKKPKEQAQPELIYFFLIRHGIYLSTSNTDDGLVELGRQQAYAAAETIDVLARSLERSSNHSSRLLFTHLIQSGFKRAYQTGLITGHRLEEMQRLEQPFDIIYKRFKCWGEIHSIERLRQRWLKIQRLFFSTNDQSSPKHYVIFSHGNLLSGIITFLMSGASWDRWHFGNIAPHCSVSILSYTPGDLFPQIVLTPFQILNHSLPITINNINPKKMRLKEIIPTGIITEQIWKIIISTIIPERVVGSHIDQISLISKFIPGNDDEARHMLFIFKQYYSQIMTHKENICVLDRNSDSDTEDDDENDDVESYSPTLIENISNS